MKKKIKHTRKNRAGDKINGDYEGEVNNKDLPKSKIIKKEIFKKESKR